jgi:hypothetical protein
MAVRSKDALARFDDLFDIGVRLVEVGAGKGMRLDPQIDVAGQFSEQDILVEPVDVVPVPAAIFSFANGLAPSFEEMPEGGFFNP